jgi:hypothetical protein
MTEFIITLIYFLIFSFFIKKSSFFNEDKIPHNWFIILFGIKVICSLVLTFIYTKFYSQRNTADIFKYYDDGLLLFEVLKTNPLDYFQLVFGLDFNTEYFHTNYYQHLGNWTRPLSNNIFSDSHIIIRFNAFVRLFSFGFFSVHNVFINFVSLVGLTFIFKAFKNFTPQKEKLLFFFISLVPSVLFWGSGLLKESIILMAMGIFFFSFFKLNENRSLAYILPVIFAVFLILFNKFYLVIALIIPTAGYLINNYFKLNKLIFGYVLAIALFVISINIFPLFFPSIDLVGQLISKQHQFAILIAETQPNSSFSIHNLTDGMSILIHTPIAVLNTLVRPFLWECNSPLIWISGIENIVILSVVFLCIIFRKKMNKSHKNIFYFNLFFIFCLFSIIGLTTPIFGAIVRYKIPGILLLLIAMVLLLDLEKIKKKFPFLSKIL